MNLFQLTTVSTLYLIHHLALAMAGTFPNPYYPGDDIVLNCGSSGISTALDGREWIGDIGSKFISSKQPIGKSASSRAVHQYLSADHVPHMTARLSSSQFTYTFEVRPGQKFIRLHFYPASYQGLKNSEAFFTVKANRYTLLSNFSAALAADALGVKYFAREFCITVEGNRALSISFAPSPSISGDTYAFINGIEIISMPSSLYYSRVGDLGARVVGNNYHFYIDNSTALEMVHRLNIGGRSILSVEDWGMFRVWSEDINYLLESDVVPVSSISMIKYTNIPVYTAPLKVYQSTWANQMLNNFTWKLPVDLGFRYLVRLHFCELQPRITETGSSRREFHIFINNQIVEANADVLDWSGDSGVAVYRDYVVTMEGNRMEGKRDLIIVLQPCTEQTGGILNGLEIFKLSNPDNNLAGPNPVPAAASAPTSWIPNLIALPFGRGNAIATGVIVVLSLLNIIFYQINLWDENPKAIGKNISKPSSENSCRCFSIGEIKLATNNFDDALVIGKGGFGKVYKGLIDDEKKTVAIKRLNSESKQGAHEFWAEIETLSKFRHIHLVSLIGYCKDSQEMIIVYEYMACGTLADHIYYKSKSKSENEISSRINWEERLNICIGAARGLHYLHTGRGARHGIIHRDVKSSNILLDENWVAKISDFGLSKIDAASTGVSDSSTSTVTATHVSTNVKGTFGYLDPDYFRTHRLTTKSDVYAFGVVLLEVLCGRPAVTVSTELGVEQQSLALWAQHCNREGILDEIVHPILRAQISPQCLDVFLRIANKCLHNLPNERPTMAEVVVTLDFALEKQGLAYSFTDEEISSSSNVSGTVGMEIDMMSTESGFVSGSGSVHYDYYSKPPTPTRARGKPKTTKEGGPNRGPSRGSWLDSLWLKLKSSSKSKVLSLPPTMSLAETHFRRFSLVEIRAATKNFSKKCLVKVSSARIYMGVCEDGTEIAIRRFRESTLQDTQRFSTELELACQLRYINLVSLIGYCYDEAEMILVYDYIPYTLYDLLHNTTTSHNHDHDISWKERLQICIGAARGLNYLHTGTNQRIIHRDVKTANILLDRKWVAKISGLGSSKWYSDSEATHITTLVMGTFGYLDPEYMLTGSLTEKSDVFSFGVVLLEVLSRRKVVDFKVEGLRSQLYLWAKHCLSAGKADHIIDPQLVGQISPLSLSLFLEIANKCLNDCRKERPLMSDVVRSLEHALKLQEMNDAPVQQEEEFTKL